MGAYRKILVAVDGSPAAGKGLREALRLAEADKAGLVILHVVNELNAYYAMEGAGLTAVADVYERLREDGRRLLEKARAAAERRGLAPKAVLREAAGSVAAVILREAKKQRADLIVLGTHGRRGIKRVVMGSDAEEVVRGASMPVLLVRSPH